VIVIAAVAFAVFALLLGFAIWWVWQQRELARKQAEMNAELARLGQTVRSVAHDLDNLFAIVLANLSSASSLPPGEMKEMLSDVERAATSASRLVRTMRGTKRPEGAPASTEPILRLVVALMQRSDVPILLEVTGDLEFRGSDADALRVLQNLLVNAVREAATTPDRTVAIHLASASLRITNAVRDPTFLTDHIYRRGVSGSGSSGMGLAIARETASEIGWSLRHEIAGGRVTFILTPAPRARTSSGAAMDSRMN